MPKFRTNRTYITKFMIIMVLAGFQIGYAMLSINRIDEFMKIRYSWKDDVEDKYITFLTVSAIFGLAFGSLASGTLMKDGRKRCMLIGTAIGVFGIII